MCTTVWQLFLIENGPSFYTEAIKFHVYKSILWSLRRHFQVVLSDRFEEMVPFKVLCRHEMMESSCGFNPARSIKVKKRRRTAADETDFGAREPLARQATRVLLVFVSLRAEGLVSLVLLDQETHSRR